MPITRCDACGLPPLPNKQLLECTRCKQAHYHDRQCQIDHYPKHKAACRRFAAAAAKNTNAKSTATSSDAPTQTPLVTCRSIDGKGRSLFATSPLDIGCHPLPTKDGLCEPIAHPVLLESMRTSRCAYCFQSIIHNNNSLLLLSRNSSSSKSTFHYHCSTKCQSLDTNWKIETHAAQKVPSPPSPTALSCSRILRKMNNESNNTPTTTTSSSSKEFNELCYNVDLLSEGEKEAYKSIMTQCHLFLRAMGDIPAATTAYNLLQHHPGDDNNLTPAYYQFMSRLSMNGFTISTSEQVPIGHGIYCGASMMNHSCRPNAVPTFWLKPSTVPMLQISVCKKVGMGEEVTIGYCDVSSPRSIRRNGLWNNYKFHCDCSLCRELDRDDKVVGLKCTSTGCKGMARSAKVQSENESSSSTTHEQEIASPKYACNTCGSTNFDKALEVQAQALSKMKRLESEMNNNQTFDKKTGEEAKHIYHQLKQHYSLQTSYYVAWSADLFVHWCANALGSCTNEQDQLHMCHEALVVVNESRSAAKFCMQHPGNLSWQIKQGIEAKLRLFVNPMDMEAHRMLRDARKELLVYYPYSDVTMKSLEESLAAYSFS